MSANTILIQVRGTPRPQPRPRFGGTQGKGRPISTGANKLAKVWATWVQAAACHARENYGGEAAVLEMLGKGPLYLEAEFRLPTKDKTKWGHWHFETTPDFDNLVKLAVDNILIDPKTPGNGLARVGDNRIARSIVTKIWDDPQKAGATLRLSRLSARVGEVGGVIPKWL